MVNRNIMTSEVVYWLFMLVNLANLVNLFVQVELKLDTKIPGGGPTEGFGLVGGLVGWLVGRSVGGWLGYVGVQLGQF